MFRFMFQRLFAIMTRLKDKATEQTDEGYFNESAPSVLTDETWHSAMMKRSDSSSAGRRVSLQHATNEER